MYLYALNSVKTTIVLLTLLFRKNITYASLQGIYNYFLFFLSQNKVNLLHRCSDTSSCSVVTLELRYCHNTGIKCKVAKPEPSLVILRCMVFA